MVVLIPAYQPNEELIKLTEEFVAKTDFSLVVVNDGSAPEKDIIFKQLPKEVTVLKHDINKGKGRAMKTGMAYIAEHFPAAEGLVVVDADGQHILPDVLRVCDALKEHPDALVIGSRLFTGKVPFRSKFGNTVTRYVFALASGSKVHDTQTGLRAFSVSRIEDMLSFKGERYEYEMNMLLGASERQIPIHEVYIETVYLDEENSSSHFNPLKDSLRIYGCIIKFAGSSLIGFLVDYVLVLLFAYLFGLFIGNPSHVLLYSAVIARVISSLCNFLINRRLVFKSKENVAPTAAKYYAVAVLILALNYVLLNAFNLGLHLPLSVAKLIVEVLLFGVSLALQRFFVFRNKEKVHKG